MFYHERIGNSKRHIAFPNPYETILKEREFCDILVEFIKGLLMTMVILVSQPSPEIGKPISVNKQNRVNHFQERTIIIHLEVCRATLSISCQAYIQSCKSI